MDKDIFRFKNFEVSHGKSSMKVGVDAVLLGAWANAPGKELLEVGTGCGVISLILAQRFPESRLTSIDIDEASIEEAYKNFSSSPWQDKIVAILENFPADTISRGGKYDMIVSNPPYFASGIKNPVTPREKARHQGDLSIFSLIGNAKGLLNPGGNLSMIFPREFIEHAIQHSQDSGLDISRICYVRNNSKCPEKRVMVEFIIGPREGIIHEEHLVLYEEGEPSSRHWELCKNLYLKF